MRTALVIGAAALVATTTGCTSAKPAAVATCQGTQLTARYGGRLSPMTGEHPALITVWNVSRTACRLPAYPTVELLAGHDRLPFRFQRGGAYIQERPKRSVVIAPRAAANFLVAKYRCDVQRINSVTAVAIEAVPRAVVVPLPAGYAGPGIDYCGPAANDPGNIVEVGPYLPGPAQGI